MIEIICRENLQKEGQASPKEKRCLPKNIRQVGSPRGRHKIYIEDYVYTFLKNMARRKDPCAAIFLGTAQVDKDIRCTFVSGAVECGAAVFQWDNIHLDDSFWDYIYKEKKHFFSELEIVGWFLGRAGQPMELPAAVEAAHRKYFAGRDKLLMMMDILEDEEIFFVHEQGYLQKREGYYIYYEKNLPMQEYMISKHEEERQLDGMDVFEDGEKGTGDTEFAGLWEEMEEEPKDMPRKDAFARLYQDLQQEIPAISEPTLTQADSDSRPKPVLHPMHESDLQNVGQERGEEVQQAPNAEKAESSPMDKLESPWEKIFAKNNEKEPKTHAEEALESYRNMALERHGRRIAKQNRNFLYTASAFFLVIFCVMGITTINNYRKMQEVEETLHILNSARVNEKDSFNEAKGEENVVVENIPSQVQPLDEKEQQADSAAGESASKGAASSSDTRQSEENDAGKSAEASASPQERIRYYTVQPGDTLDTICLDIYDSLDIREELCQLNGIEDGNKIFIGQKLQLP